VSRRWVWILILVVILVGVGLAVGRRRAPTRAQVPPAEEVIPVEVALVQRGTLDHTVEVSGSLTSARLTEVLPRRSGTVVRVLVQDGDRVTAGQPLVVLDAAEWTARVRQAAAAVSAAEARVALLEAGARPQERRQARDMVRQAESALAAARTQLQHAGVTAQTAEDSLRRMEMLLRDGAVSQAQVDQASWEADRARTQVRAAEAQVRSAEAQLSSARQQVSLVEAGARPEEVRAARAQLDQARAVLAETRQALAEMTVRAPFAGRVARVTASPGDFAGSGEFRGTTLAVVYDDQALEAEVTVGEREAALVRVGQTATLRPAIGGGMSVAAVVKAVTPLADQDSRSITLRLRLVGKPVPALVPGTFVRGSVVVERRPGVLTVPRAALRSDGRTSILVVKDGVIDVRDAVTGLSMGDRVQIVAGAHEGEQVVILGPERLAAGAKVKIVSTVPR